MLTGEEIRNRFNLQYDNIFNGASPGLNDYELSLYLTKAHREIIYAYYDNIKGLGFESTEKTRSLISAYIKEYTEINEENPTSFNTTLNTQIFKLPLDIWYILYESVITEIRSFKEYRIVKPIKYSNLWNTLNNPYKVPSIDNKVAIKIDKSDEEVRASSIIYPKEVILKSYTVNYIVIPSVVIIVDLTNFEIEGLSIEDITQVTIPPTLETNQFLLDKVINRAVELATRDYKQNNLEAQVTLNSRAE